MHAHKILIPTAILLASAATAASASAAPTLSTNQACYRVGQKVTITGGGFAPARKIAVTVDFADFGTPTTNANGVFTGSLIPGGLAANVVEMVHFLSATDGSNVARATFTVSRSTGARILATTGPATKLRAPFQVWGFSRLPSPSVLYPVPITQLPVYVHYVSPRRHMRATVRIGRTGGQCGYLRTKKRRLFPFIPSRGHWRLQVDSHRHYAAHPTGPVANIFLKVQ